MKTFKFRESLKNAWEVYKKNWKLILSSFAAYLGLVSFLSSMDSLPKPLITGAIWDIISAIFSIYISFLLAKGILKFIDTDQVGVEDLRFTNKQIITFIKTIGLLLVAGLIIAGIISAVLFLAIIINKLVALVLAIIIVIIVLYVALRLSFVTLFLTDHASHMEPVAIIKDLWNRTDRKITQIILLGLKITLLNILGFFALGVGLIITMPLSAIIKTKFYREQIQEK
jgi:hypothetical protein